MERHFGCTACGLCCFGWLPLTLSDALANAGRFPLAVVWTPVRQGSKAYDLTARLGLTVRTRERKALAVRITPTAYIPPSLPCPALTADRLCAIHDTKPSRCRTMPFFPYREEADQADLLTPRAGWRCDTSAAAPVVYRDRIVVDRSAFDTERRDLENQAALLRAYGAWVLARLPAMIDNLSRAVRTPGVNGGHVVVSFATLLRRLDEVDQPAIARSQLAVLKDFAAKVAGQPALAEYAGHYQGWAWEIERLADEA
jgi:Fe-S-cluster containining protein